MALGRRRLVVMRHLQPRPPKSTFHIKSFISFRAIEDCLPTRYISSFLHHHREGLRGRGYLITTNLLRDIIQRLNNSQPQLFALLILGHSDIFDMAYAAEIMYTIHLSAQPPKPEREGMRLTTSSPQPAHQSPQPSPPHPQSQAKNTPHSFWPSTHTARSTLPR